MLIPMVFDGCLDYIYYFCTINYGKGIEYEKTVLAMCGDAQSRHRNFGTERQSCAHRRQSDKRLTF